MGWGRTLGQQSDLHGGSGGTQAAVGQNRRRRPRGEKNMSNCYFPLTSGMVDNFLQLHKLQQLVEHLLRSSTKRVEWNQFLVEWSGVS